MNADWKADRLGNVATLQRGFDLPHRFRKPGTIPIVTSSGIEHTHCEARVKAPGVVTGRYGTIGEVFFVRDDFWPLNTTLYVRNFHGNSPLFVSYLLRTIDFHTHSGKRGVPGVNRNDLHEIAVALPKPGRKKLSLPFQNPPLTELYDDQRYFNYITRTLFPRNRLIEIQDQPRHGRERGQLAGVETGVGLRLADA